MYGRLLFPLFQISFEEYKKKLSSIWKEKQQINLYFIMAKKKSTESDYFLRKLPLNINYEKVYILQETN